LDIPSTSWLIVAALADFTLVFTHGFSGQRAFVSPLRRERLFPSRQWGDEDMSWRIFAATWHLVTAVFLCCGVVLLLLAMGVLEGNSLPFFLGAVHAVFLVVAVGIVGPRLLGLLRRPFAITVIISLVTVCVASWLGTR
jgi:hypothetical protein